MRSSQISKIILLAFLLVSLGFVYIAPNQAQAQANTNSADSGRATYKGVEGSITDFLCTPTDSSAVPGATGSIINPGTAVINIASNDLYDCINKLYRFGIAFGAIAGVFWLILAGYYYISGSEAAIAKAKGYVGGVIVGLLIMLTSFILLKQINPDLVRFRPIQPPQFTNPCASTPEHPNPYEPGGSCPLDACKEKKLGELCRLADGSLGVADGQGGGTPVPGGKPVHAGCYPGEQGICTKAFIERNCPEMITYKNTGLEGALRACNQESAGVRLDKQGKPIGSKSDMCRLPDGKAISFSYGMWQINLPEGSGNSVKECRNVLIKVGGIWPRDKNCGPNDPDQTCGRTCKFGTGGEGAFNQCLQILADPASNTRVACYLFKERIQQGRGAWGPWPWTKDRCNLP